MVTRWTRDGRKDANTLSLLAYTHTCKFTYSPPFRVHVADVISDFKVLHFILLVINRHSILGFERAVYSGVL